MSRMLPSGTHAYCRDGFGNAYRRGQCPKKRADQGNGTKKVRRAQSGASQGDAFMRQARSYAIMARLGLAGLCAIALLLPLVQAAPSTLAGTLGEYANQTCADSDNGIDFAAFGKLAVSDPSGNRVTGMDDYCVGNTLVEGYCEGRQLASLRHGCWNGCIGGRCRGPDECKDSDGGDNVLLAGTTTLWNDAGTLISSASDNCASGKNLTEYYCDDGERKSVVHSCAGMCYHGACINSTNGSFCLATSRDAYTHGVVILYDSDNNATIIRATAEDNCSNGTLVKQYCVTNNSMNSMRIDCLHGCAEGACIKPPKCVDSDDGDNPGEFGAIELSNSRGAEVFAASDECLGNGPSKEIKEYYCNGTRVESRTHQCIEGCLNGACNNGTDYCVQTSPGRDHFTPGNISGFFKRKFFFNTDVCASSSTLLEVGCNENGTPSWQYKNCENGCRNAACVKAEEYSCFDTDGGISPYVSGRVTIRNSVNTMVEQAFDRCDAGVLLTEYYCGQGQGKPVVLSGVRECEAGCFTERGMGACYLQQPTPAVIPAALAEEPKGFWKLWQNLARAIGLAG